MENMFIKCSSLTKINLFNFKNNNSINLSNMFWDCSDILKNELELKYNIKFDDDFWF